MLLISCEANKKPASQLSLSDVIQIHKMHIDLDSFLLNHYERGFNIFQDSSEFYYIAYNRHTHAIDWYDITHGNFSHRMVLEKQGPNQVIEQVYGIYVQTMDSLFLNDGVFLYLMDSTGVVLQKIPTVFETSMGLASLVNSGDSPLKYHPNRGSLLGEAILIGQPLSKTEVYFAEVNFNTQKIQMHSAANAGCYTENASVNNWVNVQFKGDSILYSITCSSEIFIYDLESQTTSIQKAYSSLSKNQMSNISGSDPETLWRHYIESPRFFQIVHSPYDNHYYRMHWKEAVYQIDEANFTTAYDKEIILSVFDENLNLIHEIILPPNQYLTGTLLPTPKGLLLNANHPKNKNYDPDKMELHVLHYDL